MEFDQLQKLLAPSASGVVTIFPQDFPDEPIKDLFRQYLDNAPLAIAQASTTSDAASQQVVASGRTAYLNRPDLAATASFTLAPDGSVSLVFRFEMIGATRGDSPWRFSDSFADLPASIDFSKSPDDCRVIALDQLQLRGAYITLATQAGVDSTYQTPMPEGMGFAATLTLAGLFGALASSLSGAAEYILRGSILIPNATQSFPVVPRDAKPWEQPAPLPGILLSAGLGIEFAVATLEFGKTEIAIYSPPSAAWMEENDSYYPAIILSGDLATRDGKIDMALSAELSIGVPQIDLKGSFEGLTIGSLADLADFCGGIDLASMLPDTIRDALDAVSSLGLESAAVCFSAPDGINLSVDYCYATIGMADIHWSPVEKFELVGIRSKFMLLQPFETSVQATVALIAGFDAFGCPFETRSTYPGYYTQSYITEPISISLDDLLHEYAPGISAPAPLVVDDLRFDIDPGASYAFAAIMAESSPWILDFGKIEFAVADLVLSLSVPQTGSSAAEFSGKLTIDSEASLEFRYATPGEFYLRGDLPAFSMNKLADIFCSLIPELPSGFDLALPPTHTLIELQDNLYKLSVSAEIEDLGLVCFAMHKNGASYGYAVGLNLNEPSFKGLPGLEALEPFIDFFGLEQLLMVVSSVDDPGFSFPDLDLFEAPSIAGKSVKLPAEANGLVAGFNFYARLNMGNGDGFQTFAKLLGLKLNGELGIVLSVSLVPPESSKLFLSIKANIASGMDLTGEFGGLMAGGQIGIFLTGNLNTRIQSQPLEFYVTGLVAPNGAFVSGTMKGTIDFEVFKLSNLALEIGVNLAGIPSAGIAATIVADSFDSSVAIFIDSAMPSQSLVAGAVSNLTFSNVVTELAVAVLPASLGAVLGQVKLKGLHAFNMPISAAQSLDDLDIEAVSAAFQQYGATAIPASSEQVLLVVKKKGDSWLLTDMATMAHYGLETRSGQIAVSKEAQFYCAPQTTTIGALQFPQGFRICAHIEYLILDLVIDIEISATQGVLVDVEAKPIVLFQKSFLSIAGADGKNGPRLSLCTYDRANETDPQLRGPHFLLSAGLRVLSVDVYKIYVFINAGEATFDITQRFAMASTMRVRASMQSLTQMSADGSLDVGIDDTLDFGLLGRIAVDVMVSGAFDMGLNGSAASAGFKGSFVFQGVSFNLPRLAIDVTGQGLLAIEKQTLDAATNAIDAYLKDADQWLEWVDKNVVAGLANGAEDVGKALKQVYSMADQDIATITKSALGYDAEGVANALQGAGLSSDEVASIMNDIGYAASDIGDAIGSAFETAHVDLKVGHIDTPAGPHADTPGAPHVDVNAVHSDINTHTDKRINYGLGKTHSDMSLGHSDSKITPHGDTKAYPHVDTKTPPHGDASTHIDS